MLLTTFNIYISKHTTGMAFLKIIHYELCSARGIIIIIIIIICADWFKSCSYSLSDSIQSPVTSSLLGLAVFHRRDDLIVQEF